MTRVFTVVQESRTNFSDFESSIDHEIAALEDNNYEVLSVFVIQPSMPGQYCVVGVLARLVMSDV